MLTSYPRSPSARFRLLLFTMMIFLRFRLPVFIVLLAMGLPSVGCDLGTYSGRAATSSESYQPPAIAKPAASKAKE